MRLVGNDVGSARFYELSRMSRGELALVYSRGLSPVEDRLVGWEFRGLNHPAWARAAGIKKFVKGFYLEGDTLYGYNRNVKQNAVSSPWIPRGAAKPYGFYLCEHDSEGGLFLDYGRGGNKRFDPTRNIRDSIVQVDGENPDLYLGKAAYKIGPVQVPTNFFLLERWSKASGRPR